jgi:hypothetical protein
MPKSKKEKKEMWPESLMNTNRTNRNITRNSNLIASLLFIFIIVLIAAGTLIQQSHAQSDLFRLVTLKPAYDERFANDIQHILNSYHWTHRYETGNFSCTDISIYIMLLLKRYGLTAECVTDWGPDKRSLNSDPIGHMWVAVEDPRYKGSWLFIDGDGGFYPNEEPLPGSIGLIVYGETYQTGYMTSNPLEYVTKYDSKRQPWRQHYSLNDSNAPKPNAA